MKQLPLTLFCLLSLKLLLLGSTPVDSVVLLIIGLFSSFILHVKSSEYSHLERKLDNLQKIVDLNSKDLVTNKKELDDTKALIGGIKLGQQIRSQNSRV